MFDATTVPMAQFAHDTTQMTLQAGPPGDLPTPVPDFVGNILSEISSSAGDAKDGLGEAISGMAPGGEEATNGAETAANETARSGNAANAANK